jgi:hypothetical protein
MASGPGTLSRGGNTYNSGFGGYVAWDNAAFGTNRNWGGDLISANNGAYTLECWFRRSAYSFYNFSNFMFCGTSGNPNFCTYTNTGSDNDILVSSISGGDSIYYYPVASYFPLNVWHQVVLTAPASGASTLYADGSSTGKTGTRRNYYSTSKMFRIGNPGGTAGDKIGWTGDTAIWRVYNAALSASEIAQNWNAQKARFGR